MSVPQRFLEYSLAHHRKIRVIMAGEKGLVTKNIVVCSMEDGGFSYLSSSNKKRPVTASMDQVLSASYARGDDGDTLQYVKPETCGEKDETKPNP